MKLPWITVFAVRTLVAPYMGAWIETPRYESIEGMDDVAPYMGAWIETGQ